MDAHKLMWSSANEAVAAPAQCEGKEEKVLTWCALSLNEGGGSRATPLYSAGVSRCMGMHGVIPKKRMAYSCQLPSVRQLLRQNRLLGGEVEEGAERLPWLGWAFLP